MNSTKAGRSRSVAGLSNQLELHLKYMTAHAKQRSKAMQERQEKVGASLVRADVDAAVLACWRAQQCQRLLPWFIEKAFSKKTSWKCRPPLSRGA